MKLHSFAIAFAAGTLLSPITLAHAQQASYVESRFKQWDRNKGGKLSKNARQLGGCHAYAMHSTF